MNFIANLETEKLTKYAFFLVLMQFNHVLFENFKSFMLILELEFTLLTSKSKCFYICCMIVFLLMKGDVKFAEVLGQMGAEVTWTENSVTVTGPPRNSSGRKHLRPVDVNMNKMPDVAMTLAVVALYADGPTTIRDGMI